MAVDYSTIFWPLLHNKIRRGIKNHTFGMVRRYATGALKPHQGWDFEAIVGTPFYAIGSGKVEFVRNRGDYGLQLCHSFQFNEKTLYAFYAHLGSVNVKEGDEVSGNQELGFTSNSGNARGLKKEDLHLHFEIRTKLTPGPALQDRMDPILVFGHCPFTFDISG